MEKLSHAAFLSGVLYVFPGKYDFNNLHFHSTHIVIWTSVHTVLCYLTTREPTNLLKHLWCCVVVVVVQFYFIMCVSSSSTRQKITLTALKYIWENQKSSQSSQSNIIIYVYFGQLLPNYSIPCEIMCPFFV